MRLVELLTRRVVEGFKIAAETTDDGVLLGENAIGEPDEGEGVANRRLDLVVLRQSLKAGDHLIRLGHVVGRDGHPILIRQIEQIDACRAAEGENVLRKIEEPRLSGDVVEEHDRLHDGAGVETVPVRRRLGDVDLAVLLASELADHVIDMVRHCRDDLFHKGGIVADLGEIFHTE